MRFYATRGAAAKVADDFFARFVDRFGKPPAAAVDADATEPGVAVPESASSQMRAALRTMSVRLALAAAIIAMMAIYWFTRPA